MRKTGVVPCPADSRSRGEAVLEQQDVDSVLVEASGPRWKGP